MLIDTQIIARARALYDVLPKSEFTASTFEELGRAIRDGIPMAKTSTQLRTTLFLIVRRYDEALTELEVREAMAVAAEVVSREEEPPKEEIAPESPSTP